jgi:formylglycine-generating enzyme required for sulfatase activity
MGTASDGIMLAMKDGPEIKITTAQLDTDDVNNLLLPEPGAGKAGDLRRRGLLFLAAGETARADNYFSKARDAGLGDAVAPYLERIAALKLVEREAAAFEEWKKAEGLFASKNWKSAKLAYETLERDYAGSAALVNNVEELKKRLETIGWALGPPRETSLDLGGGVKLELVLIPAGEFEMGSKDGNADEKPVHKVRISQSFYMGKYVVTQAQYEKVMGMGSNPSGFKGENLPVERVSYFEAEEFCKRASKLTKQTFRLPAEAEWEYACRAGTKTKFYIGDNDAAQEQAGWFKENSETKTHPVGQKKPNAWGLFDMQGNVWQWCQDWYGKDYYGKSEAANPQGPAQGTHRVMRGGSWNFPSGDCCRSARRSLLRPDDLDTYIGFRVAVTPAFKAP